MFSHIYVCVNIQISIKPTLRKHAYAPKSLQVLR